MIEHVDVLLAKIMNKTLHNPYAVKRKSFNKTRNKPCCFWWEIRSSFNN